METGTARSREKRLTPKGEKIVATRRAKGSFDVPRASCLYCEREVGLGAAMYVHIAMKHPEHLSNEAAWRKHGGPKP